MFQYTSNGLIFRPRAMLSPDNMAVYETRYKAYRPRFTWSSILEPVFDVCLVHASQNVPGKVAYFSSVQNMLDNKTTRTSPEMFLTRFLACAPHAIKEAWQIEVLGKILPKVEFIENNDPQGWIDIYEEGPGSCMKGRHEVSQYAHPKSNLRLAYFREEGGRVAYRTIVNQKTMTYLRIFSDKLDDASFFSKALKDLGYHADTECLHGEHITIEYQECNNCSNSRPHGPYLDGDYDHVSIDPDDPSTGVIGSGDFLEYEREWNCGECED